MREPLDWKKYLLALFITGAIFVTAFYVSARFDRERLAGIENTADRIAIDILSLETQFELLGELSCGAIEPGSLFSREIDSLADRLNFAEASLGADNPEVLQLKEQYFLLEIKDYLLLKRVAERCGEAPVSVLFFYADFDRCEACRDAGYALEAMREEFPDLRVYTFDYHLPLGALDTLITVLGVEPSLPAFVIGEETHYGFQSLAELRALLPESLIEAEADASEDETAPPVRL